MRGIYRVQRAALIVTALGVAWAFSAWMSETVRAQYKLTYPEIIKDITDAEDRKPGPDQFPVPVKPLPKTITPCRACHGPEKDFPVNWKREEALRVHTNLKLKHGGVRVWCLDCHHPKKRNYLLPLSDGKLIPFDKSYLLCGKCHGTKFRDWRNGIHGKRTGAWNGKKTYYLCVHCHNPHVPKFKPLEPLAPPKKPRAPKHIRADH